MITLITPITKKKIGFIIRTTAHLTATVNVGRFTMLWTEDSSTFFLFIPTENTTMKTTAENMETTLARTFVAVDYSSLASLAIGAESFITLLIRLVGVGRVIVVNVHSRHVSNACNMAPLDYKCMGTKRADLPLTWHAYFASLTAMYERGKTRIYTIRLSTNQYGGVFFNFALQRSHSNERTGPSYRMHAW